MENLPNELKNKIYTYFGFHPNRHIISDLINIYNEDYYETSDLDESELFYCDDMTFYEWYFNHARYIYYDWGNRYGNRKYLFNTDKYYDNYLGQY